MKQLESLMTYGLEPNTGAGFGAGGKSIGRRTGARNKQK